MKTWRGLKRIEKEAGVQCLQTHLLQTHLLQTVEPFWLCLEFLILPLQQNLWVIFGSGKPPIV